MTNNIKMPPMPKTEWNLHMPAQYYEHAWKSTESGYTEADMEAYAREAVRLNAQAVPSLASSDMVATERKRCESLARQALDAGMSGNWAKAEMLMKDIKWGNYYTHIQLHPIDTLSAAPAAPQPAQPAQPLTVPDAQEKDLLRAIQERDAADDYIDALLDEVLGTDRPEWSSVYGHADAIEQVRERMNTLMKPSIDKAWDRFQSSVAPAAPQPAQQDAKPIYQYQLATGGWIDQTRDSYEYNKANGIKGLRIVYEAAPQPAQADAEPLQVFVSPRAKALMQAFEDGWRSCADSEYIGKEAQNDAFNQSRTVNHCIAEDTLFTQPAQQPLTETEVMAAFDDEAEDDDAAPFVFLAGVRFAERKHGIGVKND